MFRTLWLVKHALSILQKLFVMFTDRWDIEEGKEIIVDKDIEPKYNIYTKVNLRGW